MDLRILGFAAIVLAGILVVAVEAHGDGVFGATPAMPHSEAAWKNVAGGSGGHAEMHESMHGTQLSQAELESMEAMHQAMHGDAVESTDWRDMKQMHERMHGENGDFSIGECQKMHESEGATAMDGMHERMHAGENKEVN